MNEQELENEIFKIITHSGTARANLYEALDTVRNKDYEQGQHLLKDAEKELVVAHNVQSKLIQADLNNNLKISLLLVHAQDQFMNTMTEQSLIEQMIKMQKQINSLN